MMKETLLCDHCGSECDAETSSYFDEQNLCEECLDEETSICSRCGDRIWNRDNAGNEDTPLCQACYDSAYTSCENCGCLLHLDSAYYTEDDSDPLCYPCYEEARRSGGIREYYHKPDPLFYGDAPRYFGVELEIDDGGELSSAAQELQAIANQREVLGLRWQDIDFEAGTLSVRNTVTRMRTRIEHEQTKSLASKRTLFLIPSTITYLQQVRKDQLERQRLLGSAYTITDHVCVWPDGRPLSPDYVSQHFRLFLEKHNLPSIRFHDLRHTAGSLLLRKGLNIKQVQEFLGHEKSSTTLDIYLHIDEQAKQETAFAMEEVLPMHIS